MQQLTEPIYLKEQTAGLVALSTEDVVYLNALGFQLSLVGESATESSTWRINPTEFVGHFQLPSGRITVIEPKIDAANVFRMLAYVFTEGHQDYLRPEQVSYASDSLLFEPLVCLFNDLVESRVRRGLAQDYIRREENSASFRGALNVNPHIQYNLGRDNRIWCRFFEQTVDIDDNRFIKSALQHLLRFGGWTTSTTHDLIANFHKFDSVSFERSTRHVWAHRHYHRLNDDYRPIHSLCRMFLAGTSISEKVGAHEFKGFLLNMNTLFEEFVQQAFISVVRYTTASAAIQKSEPLSMNNVAPMVKPDVTIREGAEVISIVDAKYKRDAEPRNPDIYQVVAYGTVLRCARTYLLYPHSELDSEHDFPILNSPIIVHARRVNVSTPDCVKAAEATARKIITECQQGDGLALRQPEFAHQAELSPLL